MGIPLILLQLLDHSDFPTTPAQLRSLAHRAQESERIERFLLELPDALVLQDRDHATQVLRGLSVGRVPS